MTTNKKPTFTLEPISEDLIQKNGIQESDLWMVLTVDKAMYGPFVTQRLKEYSHDHPELFKNLKVSSLDNGEWSAFSEVHVFQSRQPKLVSTHSLVSDDKFYCLKNGLKHGPYVLAELKVLLDRKEILISDEVSTDEGISWIKLYQHHEFDSLSTPKNSLPFKPENKSFHESDQYTQDQLRQLKLDKSQYDDAIVGLAFLGNNKESIHEDTDNESSKKKVHATVKTEVDNSDTQRRFKLRYVASALGMFLIIFTIANTFHNKFVDHSKKDSVAKKRVYKTQELAAKSKISKKKSAKRHVANKPTRLYPKARRQNSYSPSKRSRTNTANYRRSKSRSRSRRRIKQTHKRVDRYDEDRSIASAEEDPEVEEIKQEMLAKLREEELDDEDIDEEDSEYYDEDAEEELNSDNEDEFDFDE